MKLTPFGRWFLIIAAIVAVFFIVRSFLPGSENGQEATQEKTIEKLTLATYNWPGFSVGAYANGGLSTANGSKVSNRGVELQIDLYRSEADAINAWSRGEADLLGCSWHGANLKYNILANRKPKLVNQVDWDRGNYAIFAGRGINTVNQLERQPVGLVEDGTSRFFLHNALFMASMDLDDVEIVAFETAAELLKALREGSLKAAVINRAVVDISDIGSGARSIVSTDEITNALSHVIIGAEDNLAANPEAYSRFYNAWVSASGDLSAYDDALDSAITIWGGYLETPIETVGSSLKRLRLATHGDNIIYFGRMARYKGPMCELGLTMTEKYLRSTRQPLPKWPNWKEWLYLDALNSNNLFVKRQEQEGSRNYRTLSPSEQDIQAVATMTFYPEWPGEDGKWTETDIQNLVNLELGQRLTWVTRNRIRVHTNTSANQSSDLRLSDTRADLLRDYLVDELDLDPNRYITVGIGDREPVEGCAGDFSPQCMRKNNRVEVQTLKMR